MPAHPLPPPGPPPPEGPPPEAFPPPDAFLPAAAAARRGVDGRGERLWAIPLACLIAAILLSLLTLWALSQPNPAGAADAAGRRDPPPTHRGGASAGDGPGAGIVGKGAGAAAPTTPPRPAGTPRGNTAAAHTATSAVPASKTPGSLAPPVDLAPVAPAEELGFATAVTPAAPPAPAPGEPAASGRSGDAGAGPTFFGQVGRGSRFVYIIDRSGSMEGGRFEAARFELIKSIRSLRPHEAFSVIFFDYDATPLPMPGLLPARPDHQQAAIDWIRTVSVGGGTDPTQAIDLALDQLRPHTIWLLTDGSFDIRIADHIRDRNRAGNVQINTIGFHDAAGETVLKRIARENNGDYRFVPP